MATCKTCGAEILWIRTTTGKMHPIDAKPEKRWVWNAVDGWDLLETHISHFATCPDADQHRRSDGRAARQETD